MAKYTVAWIKEDTKGSKDGREWIKYAVTLRDEQGVEINAKTFDNLDNGSIVEGDVTDTQWGKNFKKVSPKAVAGANFKTKQIEETMQRKETSIAKFQDSKEFSIMVASSMSQAVNLAIAEYNHHETLTPSVNLETLIIKWRNWVIANWSIDKTDTPAF